MFIDGLYLKNYIGIGSPGQKMAPFKKFNFFIGANNAGKSTPLNFISKYLPVANASPYGDSKQPKTDPLEQHMGSTGGSIEFGLAIPIDKFISRINIKGQDFHKQQTLAMVRGISEFISEDNFIWLKSRLPFDKFAIAQQIDPAKALAILDQLHWRALWNTLTGQSGGDFTHHWLPETMEFLLKAQVLSIPETILIPAIRQIGPAGKGVFGNDGTGLIDKLAELQSPDHDRRQDRLIFDQINRFLQSVTDTSDASIEIPHNRVHVLVQMNGRVLPLASLGTGIHEVIMLAAACTIYNNRVVCIEEPEIHLHPILQRKFMHYLSGNTNNQYFIATHSPAFIDTPGAAIFHVSHDRKKTTIKESILRSDRYAICVDLGHRASDIVQSNAVLWVEGPSERIYMRHWISAVANELLEGVHYSIMFYGGRLLSHLSADDEDVRAFIDLRYLNQNLAVVMDSDMASAESAINPTKKRIIDEFSTGRGVAWLTAGREIENYVPYDLLQRGLSEIHSELYHGPDQGGRYDHAFYFRMAEAKPQKGGPPTYVYKNADKVKLAKWICDRPARLDIFDLSEHIAKIVEMIRRANA